MSVPDTLPWPFLVAAMYAIGLSGALAAGTLALPGPDAERPGTWRWSIFPLPRTTVWLLTLVGGADRFAASWLPSWTFTARRHWPVASSSGPLPGSNISKEDTFPPPGSPCRQLLMQGRSDLRPDEFDRSHE